MSVNEPTDKNRPTPHGTPHIEVGELLAFIIGCIVTIVIVLKTGSVDGAIAVMATLLLILGIRAQKIRDQ